MIIKQTLPFVRSERISIEIVMSNTRDKTSKQVKIITIEYHTKVVSSCRNLACRFLLHPLIRVHVKLVQMSIVLAIRVNSSQNIHTLCMNTSFMMRERPRRVSLLIDLLPAESLILLSFVYLLILEISTFMLNEVLKIQHLQITVFPFLDVFSPVYKHLPIIHNRRVIRSLIRQLALDFQFKPARLAHSSKRHLLRRVYFCLLFRNGSPFLRLLFLRNS